MPHGPHKPEMSGFFGVFSRSTSHLPHPPPPPASGSALVLFKEVLTVLILTKGLWVIQTVCAASSFHAFAVSKLSI